MFGALLLAVSMFTISDRANFWEVKNIAPNTQYAQVDEQGITTLLDTAQTTQFWSTLSGKKVLLLIHGYDTAEAYSMYQNIAANIQNEALTTPYDYIVGYVWPSYNPAALLSMGLFPSYKYSTVINQVEALTPIFFNSLSTLLSTVASLDVIVHGTGNRLFVEALALTQTAGLPPINNYFSWSATVDGESIDNSIAYYQAPSLCNNVYVFFSLFGSTSAWPDLPSFLGSAFGGLLNPAITFPPNLQVIDTSPVISQPFAYIFSKPIYDYFLQTQTNPLFTPQQSPQVQILSLGNYQPLDLPPVSDDRS